MSAAAPPNVVHVIQLAVAPVFLLSGVGVILSVLTNRLVRIVDRARLLEERLIGAPADRVADMRSEMPMLSHRAWMVNIALTLSTSCALLACLVIALLFIGSAQHVDMEVVISVMFVAAMVALVGSLSICQSETSTWASGALPAASTNAPDHGPARTVTDDRASSVSAAKAGGILSGGLVTSGRAPDSGYIGRSATIGSAPGRVDTAHPFDAPRASG